MVTRETEIAFNNFAQVVGTIFDIILGLIALLIAWLVYSHYSTKQKDKAAWANLPLDGPMQMKIEEQFTPAGDFNSKNIPCGLKIDVKISQRDWRAIADAGLMKSVLFYGDGASGQRYDPENTRPWRVEDLKRPTYACFWDQDRMFDAKETLVKALFDLRTQIDAQRHGNRVEEYEI